MVVSRTTLISFSALLVVVLFQFVNASSRPCSLKEFPTGLVCVCNATYCDTFEENLTPTLPKQLLVVSTSKGGLRFNTQSTFFNANKPLVVSDPASSTPPTGDSIKATVTVDTKKCFQKIVGFGGAHTGAVTYLLQQLPQALQDFVYESYYSATKGIGYTITRIPIGGCDFDLAPWAYNESPEHDAALSNFTTLDQRDLDRIVQIKRLIEVSGQKIIKFLGSAWSPPKWMKTNNEWFGYSDLLPQYYDTWSNYHLKYLELMREQSIDFWGITSGNEPLNGVVLGFLVPFMSLGWNPYNQAKWIAESLGPLLRDSPSKNVKLFGGDDQRYTYPWWFQSMQATNHKSIDYLDGLAVHFYADRLVNASRLDDAHALFPDKLILNTESCQGAAVFEPNKFPLLGSWDRAEDYVNSYLEDLNHSVNGWVEWNLVLDKTGGPNYVNNTVDSPVVTNAADGEIYKQPLFYVIGHFSRFLTENSERVQVTSNNAQVNTVGFKRPDGRIALVLQNKSDHVAEITLVDGWRSSVLQVPAKSVHSVVY